MPVEPALAASAGRMRKAKLAESERRAGCPQRTSGEMAWAAPSSPDEQMRCRLASRKLGMPLMGQKTNRPT
jgi:hypothetical protein